MKHFKKLPKKLETQIPGETKQQHISVKKRGLQVQRIYRKIRSLQMEETDYDISDLMGEVKSHSVHSFEQALAAFKRSSGGGFVLANVPKLSKKNLVEYEACANFSKAFLAVNGVTFFSFKNMVFDSDLVEFISEALSESEGLKVLKFENVKLLSEENALTVGESLKRRKPDGDLLLSLAIGDVSLLGPLVEASAVIGARLELSYLDAAFFDTTRYFRHWTLNASTVTSLTLSNISGLSDFSVLVLVKGLRNVSNLSSLKIGHTDFSPGSLILLKESLSIILEKYQGNRFNLNLAYTGLNDAAIWKISELFLETKKIKDISLTNVESSIAKRLISTRVIPTQNFDSVSMYDIQFFDKTEFKLLYFALKTRGDCPLLFLSEDCFHKKDQFQIEQLEKMPGFLGAFFL